MPGVTKVPIAASQATIAPSQDEQVWQVYFLPKDDPAVPTSYIAFCPFTGVCAEGNTENEAAMKWKEEAKKQFNRYFYLPELHTYRKVWYGESRAPSSPSPSTTPQGFPVVPTTTKPPSEPTQTLSPKSSPMPSSPLLSPLLPHSHTPSSITSFYVIDNYSDTEQAIAFSPQSKDVIVGKGVEELSEVDNLPQLWSDWKVSCTPLLHRNWFFSLTPHCINW